MVAYGTTERNLRSNPNTISAFLKAIAEAVVLAKKQPEVAKQYDVTVYGTYSNPFTGSQMKSGTWRCL